MPSTGVTLLAVGLGGMLGAQLRWLIGVWLNPLSATLSLGTLAANGLGAWLVGLAIGIFNQWPLLTPEWRLFVVTGLLGALTTFSAFSLEAVGHLQAGRWQTALLGMGLHVGGSLLLTGLGLATLPLLRSLLR